MHFLLGRDGAGVRDGLQEEVVLDNLTPIQLHGTKMNGAAELGGLHGVTLVGTDQELAIELPNLSRPRSLKAMQMLQAPAIV